jgi:hypothetical protein
MTTWYVIDTRCNEIINAVKSREKPSLDPERWASAEHLRFDANPPLAMLQRYRYRDERQ